jgi:macrolide transport system ATP-binding/permease protein
MSLHRWFGRVRTLFSRRRRLRDHDEEVDLHLSLMTADLQARGWTHEAAEREARRRFGGRDQVRERYRDVSGFPSLDAFAQDLRYGLRMIRRQPGFSALVVMLVAASARTPRSFRWSMRFCCGRSHIPTPIAWSSSARSSR